jgi:hypothetical protein
VTVLAIAFFVLALLASLASFHLGAWSERRLEEREKPRVTQRDIEAQVSQVFENEIRTRAASLGVPDSSGGLPPIPPMPSEVRRGPFRVPRV